MQNRNDLCPGDLWYGTSGPRDAEIVIVGESWGAEEEQARAPFVGTAGSELNALLSAAGIDRERCLLTNVVSARPQNNEMWRFFHAKASAPSGSELRGLHPTEYVRGELDRLSRQLLAFPRRVVLGFGNYALWALSTCAGHTTSSESEGRRVPTGIVDWRGSMWYTDALPQRLPFVPLIHPAAILRQWVWHSITIQDLKTRALADSWRPPTPPEFVIFPKFSEARDRLREWLSRADQNRLPYLTIDLETIKKHFIVCVGLGDSTSFAMCIPLIASSSGGGLDAYFQNIDEEIEVLWLLRKLLLHPKITFVGQNILYDLQYLHHWLAAAPRRFFDTMIAHHLLWPGLPKDLGFLSSLYCKYHWYWKDDAKDWSRIPGGSMDLFTYNCMDVVRTHEIAEKLRELISHRGLEHLWERTLRRADLAFRMMLRGVRIDEEKRREFDSALYRVQEDIRQKLEYVLPGPWYRSPKQQVDFFTHTLGLKIPKHRKTGKESVGRESLRTLATSYPALSQLFELLEAMRSVSIFRTNFVNASLSPDGRMRCSFNVAGTETFRWSSTKNPFGGGANLQTIPEGDE